MPSPIRRLVAGIATLRPDDPALVSALRLSARLGAELHLVHVAAGPAAAGTPEPRAPGTLREVAESVAPGTMQTGRVHCRVVAGVPERRLLEVAAGADASLLVLGATRRTALASAVLGTTAGHVIRNSPVPVLVVREPLPARPLRVLLTTDLSRHAAFAHVWGGSLARALCAPEEAEMRSLFVTAAVMGELPVARDHADLHAARELLDFLRAEVPPTSSAPRLRRGDVAVEIVREAQEWGADLLVLGTHGRRGVQRMFLGSVAETVLQHVPCAALVVPSLRPYRMEAHRAGAGARGAATLPAGA
ncbi:MAG: universal stress protein [Longimicrobiaceae bacterium]